MGHRWLVSLTGIIYPGDMDRLRIVLAVSVLAVLCVVAADAGAPAHALAADELETRTVNVYDVNADGSIHVTVTAQVTNRDPSTPRRRSGRVFFYTSAGFAIYDAATNLSARSGATRLAVETRDRDDPLRVVLVRFDRELYYNESIDITLEYDLASVRAAQLLVNHQYAFVPAIGQGARSLLRITAPDDRQLTIGSANCARTADRPATYACGASTAAADYLAGGRCAFTAAAPRWDCAFAQRDLVVIPFEAVAPDLVLRSRAGRVPLSGGEVSVTVQHFAGEEAWAARVAEIVRRGLPLLEEANGFPYPGPPAIEIVESGYRETHGYEGLASSQGRIRLTPVVEDQTVLHEVAHLWSGVFASRWLAEGMADYTANVVARRLGLKPEVIREPLPAAPRLEAWGPLRSQVTVTREQREREEAGYARSLRFVELLAERVGPRGITTANARLVQERIRGTARTYLDVLEEGSGVTLAPLFAEWALTPADAELLPARRAARAHAAALRERAARSGLTAPAELDQALRAWEFDRAEQIVATAAAALDTHEQTLARARAAGIDLGDGFGAAFARSAEEAATVAEEQAAALAAVSAAVERARTARSPLMRAGLLGADLAGREAEARAALARGDYRAATAAANAVQRRLDHAARDGAIRIGVALGALPLLAGLGFWRRRSVPRSRRHAVG